jgi:hypothetical protein
MADIRDEQAVDMQAGDTSTDSREDPDCIHRR